MRPLRQGSPAVRLGGGQSGVRSPVGLAILLTKRGDGAATRGQVSVGHTVCLYGKRATPEP